MVGAASLEVIITPSGKPPPVQGFWTWLHEGKNRIRKDHRQVLISKVKELVYTESEQVLNSKYQVLKSDPTAILYPKFLQHIKNY